MDRTFIELVQRQYDFLGLTDEQAERMAAIEHTPVRGLNWDTFNHWDEQEYRLDECRKILSDVQFEAYMRWVKEGVLEHEEQLRQADERRVAELVKSEEWIGWLREVHVPALVRESREVYMASLMMEPEKIGYLRNEYKVLLGKTRNSALIAHYRYARRFQPNGLRLEEIRFEEKEVLPQYSLLASGDEAVKAVAEFVLKRYEYLAEQKAEIYRRMAVERREFYEQLEEKHEKRKPGGWVTTIKVKETVSVEGLSVMSILLMDQERLGMPFNWM